jgi:hypothetical protein
MNWNPVDITGGLMSNRPAYIQINKVAQNFQLRLKAD